MPSPKVIVIEDDPDTREMLGVALTSYGFRVGFADNGLRLVSLLHVDEPDLILMDAGNCWADSASLCRTLVNHPRYGRVPIILISAYRRPQDVMDGLSVGAVDYFPKPLALGTLLARIRETIEVRRAERGLE